MCFFSYARFSLIRSQNLSSSYQKAKGPFQLAMVDVIGNGLVRPQWYSDSKGELVNEAPYILSEAPN